MDDVAPRLSLATPPLVEAGAFATALNEALAGGDVASLLIRFANADERENEAIARVLAPSAQEKGVAVLVAAAPNVALRAGADGAHVSGCGEALVDAIKKLSPRYIIGAGDLETRDDAMRAGEAGADYVMFSDRDREALIECVAWWAQLFNTPCVARAATLDDIALLVKAGADFVLLDDAVWNDALGPAAAVAEAQARLKGERT
ncbi:MAG: thiamine phosphate synthase [Alphaproteobacteria bacterium]|nr:thiamine phosphate synthase [Alphaproteobacteria bacterium]MBM3625139.1 thiamine phosphate synthase [Alphaproteobacteria bacterium]